MRDHKMKPTTLLAGSLLFAVACGGASHSDESATAYAPPSSEESAGGESEGPRGMSTDSEGAAQTMTVADSDTEDLMQEISGFELSLAEALDISEVDCDAARDLGSQICNLSERVCDIAADHPEDNATRQRCTDGRERCERANSRTDDRCP